MTRNSFVISAAVAAMGWMTMGCTPATEGSSGGDTPSSGAGDCTVAEGKPACEVEGEHVGGDGPATLGGAKGSVVIVDFWATWCDPCKKSFPVYQSIVDKYAGKVAVIAVSVDDPDEKTVDDLKAFAKEYGDVTFPLVWDKTKTTSGMYKPDTMPTSYIIDTQGIVRHIHVGFKGDIEAKMDAELEELLK